MKIYEINILADYGDEGWCFTENEPVGIGLQTYKFDLSEPLRIDEINYPITIQLDDENKGLKKGSFIGNVSSMLIVSSPVKEIINQHMESYVEYHQFQLLDHKGRVHSEDYWIVNPLQAYDYLHLEESDIDFENGEVDTVWEMVLDKSKMKDAPHLFRVLPTKGYYYISETLKNALEEINVTNFVFKEIPVA